MGKSAIKKEVHFSRGRPFNVQLVPRSRVSGFGKVDPEAHHMLAVTKHNIVWSP